MAAVKMYIDKFKKEVVINADHPLAIAQRVKKPVVDKTVFDKKPVVDEK